MSPFAVQSLDHVVLTVKSIQATVDFYTTYLGMSHETFVSGEGIERNALRFGNQKINLHLSGHEFEPKAARVQCGSAGCEHCVRDTFKEAMLTKLQYVVSPWKERRMVLRPTCWLAISKSDDLCFITDHPIDDVLSQWKSAKIEILEGGKVVDRTGAVGKLRSVYCRDLDGNLIEVSNYT